ncbi:hypothetical protein ACLB2K_010037 [Fragaria x ananassa]
MFGGFISKGIQMVVVVGVVRLSDSAMQETVEVLGLGLDVGLWALCACLVVYKIIKIRSKRSLTQEVMIRIIKDYEEEDEVSS